MKIRLSLVLFLLVPYMHAQSKSAQIASLSKRETIQAAVKFIRKKPLSYQERAVLKKVAISGAIVTAVAAITGLASAYVRSRLAAAKNENSQQPYQVKPRTSIEAIARKYGEQIPIDASPRALIVRGALGGSLEGVRSLTDLVSENVLNIARDVAQSEIDNDPDPQKTGVYRQIKVVLNDAIKNFSNSQFLKNMQFIQSATAGLLGEVKQNVCKDLVKPSKNAIAEALEQLKRKVGTAFKEIQVFLRNPRCETY
jgi:hypothetical protein